MNSKKTLFLGIFCGLIVFCHNQLNNNTAIENRTQGTTQQSAVFSFSSELISQAILDTGEGYDARDQFNQPVRTAQARQSLKLLFVGNLFTMLRETKIYSTAKAVEILYSSLNLLSSYFTTAARAVSNVIPAIFTAVSLRKILIITMWAFLFAFIARISKVTHLTILNTPFAKVAPLVMRC